MILKVIHPRFKIDLEDKGLTLIEENSWYNDRFFTKYVYPVEFEIPEDLDRALGHITSIHKGEAEQEWDVILLAEGKAHKAILNVEHILGRRVAFNISYGYEELPNWNTKLSALPFPTIVPGEGVLAFAKSILNQKWPAVNFNFPQVFPPEGKIDTEDEQWAYFEGVYNNYDGSDFLLNEYDIENDQQINRNIIQPMPYLLYILQVGFQDAGLELTGDILEDPDLKKAYASVFSDYYASVTADSETFKVLASEYESLELRAVYDNSKYHRVIGQVQVGVYEQSYTIDQPGKYRVFGNCALRAESKFRSKSKITLGSDVVYQAFNRSYDKIDQVEFDIEVKYGESRDIIFTSVQQPFVMIDGVKNDDIPVLDLTINKLAEYNSENEAVPTLLTPSEIKLSEAVPDMTFGDFFKAIRNYRNYGLTIADGKAVVNRIESSFKSMRKVSFKKFEVREPLMKQNQKTSFLIKFKDIDSELFNQPGFYIDKNGSSTQGYEKTPETSEIVIDLLPMPNRTVNAKSTAQMLSDDKSRLQIGLYGGLIGTLNLSADPERLSLATSVDEFYMDWLNFRLFTRLFEYTFRCTPEESMEVDAYAELQAYSSRFIPQRVSKKSLNKDAFEITVEMNKLI